MPRALPVLYLLLCCRGVALAELAQGVVFHDQNGNATRDSGEPGIPGVRVSNGLEIVHTDAAGKYQLSVGDDTIVFVVKPRNWQVPLDEQNLPQFYYIHKPTGSPDDNFDFAGVEPTGPLPTSIDFPLRPSEESDEFSVVLIGDPQPYSRQEIRYYANDLIAELVDADVAFGISLGDIVGDRLSLLEHINRVQAKVGVPWRNVHGNHDMNYQAPNDQYADETFERYFGPTNYAFQWAGVHFLVLDNVVWHGPTAPDPHDKQGDGKPKPGHYVGGFNDRQLQFVANYVADVPVEQRIVICTHIPLFTTNSNHYGTPQLPQLLEILKNHPYQMSFSAHTHYTRDDFMGDAAPSHVEHTTETDHAHHHFQFHHHHNTATGSGSWYRGPKDEQGFPMTPMRDGVPNGYVIATFNGNDYQLRYKAARMPKDFQMSIHAPEVISISQVAETEIVANVFNGNQKSKVRMRVREYGDWVTMTRTEREDPTYRALFERDVADMDRVHRALPEPIASPHIWVAKLPAEVALGVHVLEVESTDMFGHIDRGIRLIEVDLDPPPQREPAPAAEKPSVEPKDLPNKS